ncbi:hypothetical protein FXB40_00945 [Bradyrhizobium rifense]|uniref:Uncharacterized protein n=1 Tax=Bradyrhizobium rifense TaxID=515499 RepID=A0A5D3KP23_9BRAD|nr:hypothetical protein [Bradyrhizobium rifense]TYM00119.1 hypothetical protein FXB40_00945 [Bradyrhizobium rifense]
MAKLIKVRFHQFGGTTCFVSTGSNSQDPTPVRSWFPFGRQRQSGRLQDEVRALIEKLRKDKQPVA